MSPWWHFKFEMADWITRLFDSYQYVLSNVTTHTILLSGTTLIGCYEVWHILFKMSLANNGFKYIFTGKMTLFKMVTKIQHNLEGGTDVLYCIQVRKISNHIITLMIEGWDKVNDLNEGYFNLVHSSLLTFCAVHKQGFNLISSCTLFWSPL